MSESHQFDRFVVDDVAYNSLDEVPEEHRRVIRDAMERAEIAGEGAHRAVTVSYDGVDYPDLSALPESQQAILKRVLADKDGDGVPDIMEAMAPMQQAIVRKVISDGDGDGIPDIVQGALQGGVGRATPGRAPEPPQPLAEAYPLDAVIRDDPHLGKGVWIAIAAVVALAIGFILGQTVF